MHGPIYVRRYLLNLARLGVTTGLAVGLFGTAALLLAGRFLAAYGDLLFLAAVLLPVWSACWVLKRSLSGRWGSLPGAATPAISSSGCSGRRSGFLEFCGLHSCSLGEMTFGSAYSRVPASPAWPTISSLAFVRSCSSADTCFRTCSASGPFGGGACSPRRSICCLTACVQAGTISRRSCLCVCLGSWRII